VEFIINNQKELAFKFLLLKKLKINDEFSSFKKPQRLAMVLIAYQFIPPSIPLWILAWFLLIIGMGALAVLILYTKYGRELSIKLSVITIVISSIFLAFAFHFILLNIGV